MLKKNTFIILIFFLVTSCGFTPIYKNNQNLNFWLEIDKIEGNDKFNNFIKLNLQKYIYPKQNSNKIVISFNSNYQKRTLVKNLSGTSAEYELIGTIDFTLIYKSQTKKITFNEIARIKNLNNTFDEINYEASNLNNFSSSMVQKLILEIKKLNDS